MPVFYYGVLKAGGTVVNFNPLYSHEEIEFQIRDSGTEIMVTLDLELTFDKIEAHVAARGALDKAVVASFAALLPQLKAIGLKLAAVRRLAAPEKSPERKQDRRQNPRSAANDGRYRRPAIDTGCDRGAAIYRRHHRHAQRRDAHPRQSLHQCRSKSRPGAGSDAGEGDRVLGVLPLFHVFAMTAVMNFGISQGMEMILLPRFELIER